jgi:hypothetical protein
VRVSAARSAPASVHPAEEAKAQRVDILQRERLRLRFEVGVHTLCHKLEATYPATCGLNSSL